MDGNEAHTDKLYREEFIRLNGSDSEVLVTFLFPPEAGEGFIPRPLGRSSFCFSYSAACGGVVDSNSQMSKVEFY